VPDESDEERREIERWADLLLCLHSNLIPIIRMVAEAAAGKSKHHQMQAEARAAAKLKQEEMHRGKQAAI
jgi:hypothetical protein